MLDHLIPTPRLLEIDHVELAAPPAQVWELLRHGNLARSPLIRALFALRGLPRSLRGEHVDATVRVDDLKSSIEQPGFQILKEDPPHAFAVGAIGKVWRAEIPFVHVNNAREFADFADPGFVKVAWSIRTLPWGERDCRVEFELRVDATDDESWRMFKRYFRLIGPASHFIRRTALASLARELGTPEVEENDRPLAFDDLLPDASVQVTHRITGRLHAAAIRPLHHFMQGAMLRHLAERAEDRLPRDDAQDVLEGVGGVTVMIAAFLTPFFRRPRSHWGVDQETAARAYPGDELVAKPRWSFTHGVEIQAPASRVWPWIAQIGADRAGFYSYQWLENVVGCELSNAEIIHPEWEARVGQALVLHPAPQAPRLQIVAVEPGHHVIAEVRADERARASGKAWAAASWLFFVEPLSERRCRFISRYRAACSDDVATRLAFGPSLIEPVGFAMDRRMLLGVQERAERAEHRVPARVMG